MILMKVEVDKMNNFFQQQLYHNYQINQEKKLIRKESNKLSFMLFIAIIFMNIAATVLFMFISFFGQSSSLTSTASQNSYSSYDYIINGLGEFAGFFVVPFVFCLIFHYKFSNVIPVSNNKKYNPLLLVLGGYAICTIANIAVSLLDYNLSIFGLTNTTGVEFTTKTPLDQVIYFICIAIIPALTEEFMFRGVILNSFRKFGDGFAILMSSLLFGFMHGNFVQIPFAFIVGLACGFIVVKTNSIIPAMVLHLLNNGISVIFDIVANYVGDNLYSVISSVVIFVLTLLGFISIVLLIKKGLNFKFGNKSIVSLGAKDRIVQFFANPGTIILLSFFIIEAFITLIGF